MDRDSACACSCANVHVSNSAERNFCLRVSKPLHHCQSVLPAICSNAHVAAHILDSIHVLKSVAVVKKPLPSDSISKLTGTCVLAPAGFEQHSHVLWTWRE